MALSFDFSDRVFVVTGGARGIGLEIVEKFLKAGATVVLWDHSSENLEVARRGLSAYSSRTHTQCVDVGDRASVNSAVSDLSFEIDGLINNAGITRDKSFAKMSVDEFQSVIDTNLGGVFHVTQALLEKFKSGSSEKRIVNISSVVALFGNFGQTNYVASKAGVIGMTKTWARELGRKGFTVNAIAPGFIRTEMTDVMPAESLESMKSKIPSGRLGTSADVANSVLFLCSPEASYINGCVLSVDGGLAP